MKKFYVGLTTIFLSALFSGANAQDYDAQIDALQNFTNDLYVYTILNLYIHELNKDKSEIINWVKTITEENTHEYLEEFTKITEEYRTDYKPKPYKKKRSY